METNKIYRVISYIDGIDGSLYVELETEDYYSAVAKAYEIASKSYPVIGDQLVAEILEVTILKNGSKKTKLLDIVYNATPLPNDDNTVVATVSWNMYANDKIDIHNLELLKNTNYRNYADLKGDPEIACKPFNILFTVDKLVKYYNAVKAGELSKAPYPLNKVNNGFHVVESFLEKLGLITSEKEDVEKEVLE